MHIYRGRKYQLNIKSVYADTVVEKGCGFLLKTTEKPYPDIKAGKKNTGKPP